MKVMRETHEYIKTESGDLEVDLDIDSDGVPVDVTRLRWLVEEDERLAIDRPVPAEVILRLAEIIKQRRNERSSWNGFVCIEHGSYRYDEATGKYRSDCPKCKPDMDKVTELT